MHCGVIWGYRAASGEGVMRKRRIAPVQQNCSPASLAVACLLTAAGTWGSAWSQTAGLAEESEAGPSLQEIVVTATRREESASKIPLSITAVSQDTMDELGVKDFQDLARYVPGVNIDPTGTNAISIRGISSSAGAGTTGV